MKSIGIKLKNRGGLILISILLALSGSCNTIQHSKPNIIFITVDDLNDWVGVLEGHPQVKTPSIDLLASKGMLFANAHAQTAICNPSRASIMTSLYPSTTGIYFNSGDIEDSKVAKNSILLTQRFEKEGYDVTGAGKLYHTRDEEYMSNYAGNFGGFGPFPEERISPFDGTARLWDWGAYPDSDHQTPDFKVSDLGIKKINSSNNDQPLFIGLGFYRPHVPLYAPKKWFDLYPLNNIQVPEVYTEYREEITPYGYNLTKLDENVNRLEPTHDWLIKNNQKRKLVQSYLTSISFVDAQIGKVVNALENSSIEDNTYIILFSDHGFHLGEKEIWGKQTLWERSTRIPLIITGPGIPEGTVTKKPVQLLDIYPTLLELTGLDADSSLEGRSLVPLLKNPEVEWPYMARSSFGPGNYALRSENYRYILYNDGSEEFYDHNEDSREWYNLIDNPEYYDIINTHRNFLPEKSPHPILSSGSTAHRAYMATERLINNKK